MNNQFFEKPTLNSPYGYPVRHWELDDAGQPTQRIIETRRRAEFITPIPKPKKRKGAPQQDSLLFDEGVGLTTSKQRYDHTAIINSVRQQVDAWRKLPNTNDWRVTPETARLLQHWRQHKFGGIRPFFCQIEAVETAIWLTEVAPQAGKVGGRMSRRQKIPVLAPAPADAAMPSRFVTTSKRAEWKSSQTVTSSSDGNRLRSQFVISNCPGGWQVTSPHLRPGVT